MPQNFVFIQSLAQNFIEIDFKFDEIIIDSFVSFSCSVLVVIKMNEPNNEMIAPVLNNEQNDHIYSTITSISILFE